MTHELLLTEALPDVGMRALAAQTGVNVIVLPEPTASAMADALPKADGVVMVMEEPALDAGMIARAVRLRVACRFGAGYDNFDVSALTARGIPLVTTADANADVVAEHALYMMLALAKRGPVLDREVKGGVWWRRFGAVELHGKTCLIVGYGRVGRRIAALASAFAMGIVIVDPAVSKSDILQGGYAYARTLDDALPRADFIILACAYTPATKHLIGTRALSNMKRSAFIVNVARGAVVDERDLAAALDSGQLAGAGLDVLETEPPQPGNPLLARDNVVLTPHSAAFIDTAYDRMALSVVDKAARGLRGLLTRGDVVNPACFDES
jgi:D-3-phosphoglycerate dehydrogenase